MLPIVLFAVCAAAARAATAGGIGPRTAWTAQTHDLSKLYDEILDLYVRDGFVYYRALKAERAKLDNYLAALASASVDSSSNDQQVAFWLNAYNALVLRTVVDHYPIARRTGEYPQHSIRQIPGAFDHHELRSRDGGVHPGGE